MIILKILFWLKQIFLLYFVTQLLNSISWNLITINVSALIKIRVLILRLLFFFNCLKYLLVLPQIYLWIRIRL